MIDNREFYSKDVEDVFVLCSNIEQKILDYDDYVAKVCLASIRYENGSFYLNPKWRQILVELNLSPEYCAMEEKLTNNISSCVYMDWDIVKEILMLETEKNNKIYSSKSKVMCFMEGVIDNLTSDMATTLIEEMIEKSKEGIKEEA